MINSIVSTSSLSQVAIQATGYQSNLLRITEIGLRPIQVFNGPFIRGSSQRGVSSARWDYSRSFMITQNPISAKLFARHMPDYQVQAGCENKPVTNINWYEATSFAERLSWSTGVYFSLPTSNQLARALQGPAVNLTREFYFDRFDMLNHTVGNSYENHFLEWGGKIFTSTDQMIDLWHASGGNPIYAYRVFATPEGNIPLLDILTDESQRRTLADTSTDKPYGWGIRSPRGLIEEWGRRVNARVAYREGTPQVTYGRLPSHDSAYASQTRARVSSLQLRSPDERDPQLGFRLVVELG